MSQDELYALSLEFGDLIVDDQKGVPNETAHQKTQERIVQTDLDHELALALSGMTPKPEKKETTPKKETSPKKEYEKINYKTMGLEFPKLPGIQKRYHKIHDVNWLVVSGYQDGSAVVNATFIWEKVDDVLPDITAGKISTNAPYCFIITLFHMNVDFFVARGIKSPYALMVYLTRAGMPPKSGVMYNDETILPVARHFQTTIYLNIIDAPHYSHAVNDKDTNITMMLAHLCLTRNHYISGLEFI